MHPKDDMLRAFHDQELSAPQAAQMQEHLLHCAACQERLRAVARRAGQVQNLLDPLAPGPLEGPRAPLAAYRQLAGHLPLRTTRKEPVFNMFKHRTLITAITAVVLLALVFTLTPASAWASSLLGLFRVQRVQVITFDPAAVENARGQLQSNEDAIQQIFKDDLKIDNHGQEQKVASAAEAASKVGFTPRLPAALPDLQLEVKPGMNAIFTIDQPKLQALIDAAGADVKLDPALNGKVVTVDVPDAVLASSGCPAGQSHQAVNDNCTTLVQLPSPVVNAPEGLNVQELGQAMFQFLGLSKAEAEKLSQRIDWTSTLVLPIPQDNKVTYQDVQVDGVSATLLQYEGEKGTMVLWVKDGTLYGLHVPGGADEALSVANSLQ